MTEHDNEELIEAGEAAKYLAERWGIESYSVDAFKQLRYRWNLTPAFTAKKTTFWRKSDLDKIPKPDKSKPRPKRGKKVHNNEGDGESLSSVLFYKSTHQKRRRRRLVPAG